MDLDSTSLNVETQRLSRLFIPEYNVSGIDITAEVLPKGFAAIAFHQLRRIFISKNYDWKDDEELKLTILHELGHIVHDPDPSHGSGFEEYYELLKSRQENIPEKLVPDKYKDFVFM